MNIFLQFLVIGLATGGVYALVAQGLVVIYRGSGVLNFSQGAIALVGAGVFYTENGRLPHVVAMVLAVAASALTGLVVHLVVMRPMRRAAALMRLVATLGLWVVIDQIALLIWGTAPLQNPPWLPAGFWRIGSVVVLQNRVIIFVISAALTVALTVIYGRTGFGRATTAVAEKEDVARSLGYSSERLAALNWTVGGALAGLAGVLLLTIEDGFVPSVIAVVILPAVAAGLVGSYKSFPLTFLGGLIVGVVESLITQYADHQGWADAAPFIVVLILMIIRGRGLPVRGHIHERLPNVGDGKVRGWTIATVTLLAIVSFASFSTSWSQTMITTVSLGLVGLSCVVVVGYAGQISLAQYSIAGIAALASGRIADTAHISFIPAAFVGVAVAVVVGLLFALPALRLRGVNLAIVTLGLATMVYETILTNPKYDGGIVKGTVVGNPKILGFNVGSVPHPGRWATVVVLAFVCAGLVVANLRRGAAGRRLLAVRSNETAAASLGISVTGAKLYAFGVGAAIAGVGGVLLAFQLPSVTFTGFDPMTSINVLLWTVIGGIAYIGGALFGGALAPAAFGQWALGHFVNLSNYVLLIGGVLLLVTILTQQNGQVEQFIRVIRRLRLYDRGTDAELQRPPMTTGPTVAERVEPKTLDIQSLSVAFGSVRVLEDVSLTVAPGQVVGLLGPNGAGKTTLIDAVTGAVRFGGAVTLNAVSVKGWPMFRRARRGLGRSFQSVELFEDLTVMDNLLVAADLGGRWTYARDLIKPGKAELGADLQSVVERFDLLGDLRRRPSELSHARRREVAIARTVAHRPSVVLLDEPAAGLDQSETENLGQVIRALAEEWGMAVLLIEHNVPFVAKVCDHVIVLDNGRVIASGTPESALTSPEVVVAYLGAPPGDPASGPEAEGESGKPAHANALMGGSHE